MSQRELADQYEKDLKSKAFVVMQKIGNKQSFFQYYYQVLPKFKTNKSAFEAVNLLHQLLFGESRFPSWEAFKKAKNRNLNLS